MSVKLQRGCSDSDLKGEQETKQITVVLEQEGESQWPISIKENIERDSTGELRLNDIILKLKKHNFYGFFDSSVSYYHEEKKIYIFCFYLPKSIEERELFHNTIYQKSIPLLALEAKKGELHCKLKFRKKCKSKLELLREEQETRYMEEEVKKATKQKEKTIRQVIEKVALWRKLYTGFLNESEQFTRFELEDAANSLGVIKKTLDDYLLQIRNGKRYGFNFHMMRKQKIGELRSFVKEKKSKK